MKIIIVIALLALGVQTVSRADETGTSRLIAEDGYDCLRVSEFGLAGIRLWETREKAIRKLGKPQKISHGSGEDDGGSYQVTILSYPAFTIEIVRGLVDRIVTESSLQPTPEGIRVGDSRAEMIGKLGGTPRNWEPSEPRLWVVTCFEKDTQREDYVIYTMNNNDQLTQISYEASRP